MFINTHLASVNIPLHHVTEVTVLDATEATPLQFWTLHPTIDPK
jgi:hypothetical protein